MLSQGHMGAPLYHYTSQVCLSHRIFKMFEPLLCCHKGIWVHPYTITPAKLAPAPCLGIQVHLRGEHDAITSWLRLISTSDCFTHPYWTCAKYLSSWYAVSRAYGCALIPLHQPSWPQREFKANSGEKMLS